MTAPTLKPGDPPPFWEGLWHPEGKTEGAVRVTPLMTSAQATVPQAAPAPAVAAAIPMPAAAVESAPEAPAIPLAAPAAAAIPLGAPAAPAPAAPAAIPLGAAPAAEPAPSAPKSYVLAAAGAGPLVAAAGLPSAAEPEASAALRARAKELQAAGQLGAAVAALGEALKRSPGEAASYAQLGSLLLAGRATEDAAHHVLLAFMLAPREAGFGRMTLHAAWMLGYVGWAYQIAQTLYKAAPAQDLADIGKAAAGWLQGRAGAHTSLCPSCRATAVVSAPGPCARCGAATTGAPANAAGFGGLKFLQAGGPSGRLFVGAACASCKTDTLLVLAKGGPCCQHCRGPALASL